jgi:hypothetical protein
MKKEIKEYLEELKEKFTDTKYQAYYMKTSKLVLALEILEKLESAQIIKIEFLLYLIKFYSILLKGLNNSKDYTNELDLVRMTKIEQ